DDGAVAGELPVRGDGGVAVDAELLGEGAHRRQQVAGGQLAAVDQAAHAAGDLRGGAAADLRGGTGARRGSAAAPCCRGGLHPPESRADFQVADPCDRPPHPMLRFGLDQSGAGRVAASGAVGPRRASCEGAPMSAPAPTPSNGTAPSTGTGTVKRGLAEMLKGGVIMDVVTPEQARIAEDAGAVAVMALERVPADIRAQGGVSRMSDPDMIDGIVEAVSIPVMAKARIGHFVEA